MKLEFNIKWARSSTSSFFCVNIRQSSAKIAILDLRLYRQKQRLRVEETKKKEHHFFFRFSSKTWAIFLFFFCFFYHPIQFQRKKCAYYTVKNTHSSFFLLIQSSMANKSLVRITLVRIKVTYSEVRRILPIIVMQILYYSVPLSIYDLRQY